jgi:hypothetical protein
MSIVTTSLDRISIGSAVAVQAQLYHLIKGDTTTPSTTTQVRAGPTSWTQTFTAAGAGTARDLIFPQAFWAIAVTATGAVTSWDVRLELSEDNTNWTELATTIINHTNLSPGTGLIAFQTDAIPRVAYYARIRVSAIVLGGGTNIVVRLVSAPIS